MKAFEIDHLRVGQTQRTSSYLTNTSCHLEARPHLQNTFVRKDRLYKSFDKRRLTARGLSVEEEIVVDQDFMDELNKVLANPVFHFESLIYELDIMQSQTCNQIFALQDYLNAKIRQILAKQANTLQDLNLQICQNLSGGIMLYIVREGLSR